MSATVARLPNPWLTNPFRHDLLEWFVGVHSLAVIAIAYMSLEYFSWATVSLAAVLFLYGHLSITMGVHRYWAHRAYKASTLLRGILHIGFLYVMQNSELWWIKKHICHHAYSDTEKDPYTVLHGFGWAHWGWILRSTEELPEEGYLALTKNRWLLWQHTHYRPLGVIAALVFPTIVAALWGDALGGLLVAGFLRLCIQYHATWCINSVAHYFGPWRYSPRLTARTCYWVLAFTVGEWAHEKHHEDERNPWLGNERWYDFDPGGYMIWLCTKLKLASYN